MFYYDIKCTRSYWHQIYIQTFELSSSTFPYGSRYILSNGSWMLALFQKNTLCIQIGPNKPGHFLVKFFRSRRTTQKNKRNRVRSPPSPLSMASHLLPNSTSLVLLVKLIRHGPRNTSVALGPVTRNHPVCIYTRFHFFNEYKQILRFVVRNKREWQVDEWWW